MAQTARIFEPITDDQIRKLHTVAREKGIDEPALYGKIAAMIGFPSITSLSKQEAVCLIRRLEGEVCRSPRPPRPPEDLCEECARKLPRLGHVRAVRAMARELGWDKAHLKAWLHKYVKVDSIRGLDRDTARNAFLGLRNILARRRRPPG